MVKRILGVNFRRRDLRAWTAFMVVSWLIPLSLYLCQAWLNPLDDYADQGVTGPYAVVETGSDNGRRIFQAAGRLEFVMPGQRFGWISVVCLEAGASMLAHADLVRRRDRAVVVAGPQRYWTPNDKRCGPALGTMTAPADLEEGGYQLTREGIVRPFSWFPLQARLTGLQLQVRAPNAGPIGPEPASGMR